MSHGLAVGPGCGEGSDALPPGVLDNAVAGAVVMGMGAGSIGLVPGKVVEMLETTGRSAPAGH